MKRIPCVLHMQQSLFNRIRKFESFTSEKHMTKNGFTQRKKNNATIPGFSHLGMYPLGVYDANVVSEAIMAGIPIIASNIDGNIGLLGADYSGYFCTGNTEALACLLNKVEQDPRFLERLTVQIIKRQGFFKQSRENQAWQALLKKITNSR